MEPVLPAQDSGDVAPWAVDHRPSSGQVYIQCAEHVKRTLGVRPWQLLAELSQDEWRSLLLDAYRELVATGAIIPPHEE